MGSGKEGKGLRLQVKRGVKMRAPAAKKCKDVARGVKA